MLGLKGGGLTEAELFWTDFPAQPHTARTARRSWSSGCPRRPWRRCERQIRPPAVARCILCNLLVHALKGQRGVVSAPVPHHLCPDHEKRCSGAGHGGRSTSKSDSRRSENSWRMPTGRARPHEFSARAPQQKIYSTNLIERLKRRDQTPYRCSRYLPNEAADQRGLVGALLLEQNDEWALCRR